MARFTNTQIARYLAGLSTPDEIAEIQAWLDEDPAARSALEAVHTSARPDIEQVLNSIFAIQGEDSMAKAIREDEAHAATQTSAESVVPARQEDPAHTNRDRVARSSRNARADVARRQRHASPARASRSPRTLWTGPVRAAAAIAVIAFAGALMLWSVSQKIDRESDSVVYESAPGERMRLNLVDGTTVELNVASRLEVPRDFGEHSREVQLVGQAFFAVARDTTRPFVVDTRHAVVNVLGTSFDVAAYASEPVSVVVATGRVTVAQPGSKNAATTLSPGEMVRLDPASADGGRITAARADTTSLLAWRTGRLVFDGTPLTEVATRLSRWYDVEIVVTDFAIADKLLDASFERSPLEDVLASISRALEISYTRDGKRVRFSTKS